MGQAIVEGVHLDLHSKGLSIIPNNRLIVAIGAVDNDEASELVDENEGHARVYT